MEKSGGRKSRATVPLSKQFLQIIVFLKKNVLGVYFVKYFKEKKGIFNIFKSQ